MRKIQKKWTIGVSVLLGVGAVAIHQEVVQKPTSQPSHQQQSAPKKTTEDQTRQSLAELEYSDQQTIEVNNNQPNFNKADFKYTVSWKKLSQLDEFGRVGVANAVLGEDLMPAEERKPLKTKPTGWQSIKVGGKWLYNRCHLLGFQLTGEQDNPLNLMTGTQSLNQREMLTYENKVASYIKNSKKHVRYRVTPVFKGDELLARGVEMEAQSVEETEAVKFDVYIFNVQKNVTLDYQTGRVSG